MYIITLRDFFGSDYKIKKRSLARLHETLNWLDESNWNNYSIKWESL